MKEFMVRPGCTLLFGRGVVSREDPERSSLERKNFLGFPSSALAGLEAREPSPLTSLPK